MCVPGPGKYLSAGPRSWPGRAMEGTAIAVVKREVLVRVASSLVRDHNRSVSVVAQVWCGCVVVWSAVLCGRVSAALMRSRNFSSYVISL